MKLRILLAAMVINAGKVVPVSQLAQELWPEGAPRTAATAMHVYVSQLRKHLLLCRLMNDSETVLLTRQPGYVLQTAENAIDLSLFRFRLAQATEAELAGDLRTASEQLHRGLSLWSGDALADVRGGAMLHHFAKRLEESRLATIERKLCIDLRLGRHHDVVGELQSLVAQYPQWENFHGYLMIGLYRSGRTAEALTVYARLRERLIDRLGMEPAGKMQELHRLVLSRDSILNHSDSVRLLAGEGAFVA
ncbi:AfsR/SARP family transcriptional regulator [Amycolatopsis sp. NPDC005003]